MLHSQSRTVLVQAIFYKELCFILMIFHITTVNRGNECSKGGNYLLQHVAGPLRSLSSKLLAIYTIFLIRLKIYLNYFDHINGKMILDTTYLLLLQKSTDYLKRDQKSQQNSVF